LGLRLPKTGAFKFVGKLFLASGLCGSASGQRATAVLLARNRQTNLAREQTLACIDQSNEAGLRSPSTNSRYRLLVLVRGFGSGIDQPPLLDLARNLFPRDLRGRF
jgi:hypothetical protein